MEDKGLVRASLVLTNYVGSIIGIVISTVLLPFRLITAIITPDGLFTGEEQ